MTNVWSYVGTAEVESKSTPGTKVMAMPYGQALAYSDTVLRKSIEVPEEAQLGWMVKNDQLTRSRMASHQLQGWPPCEALQRALSETVEWAIIPTSSSSRLQGPGHRPLDQLDRPVAEKRSLDTARDTSAPKPPKGAPPARGQPTVTTLGETRCYARVSTTTDPAASARWVSNAQMVGTFVTVSSPMAEGVEANTGAMIARMPERYPQPIWMSKSQLGMVQRSWLPQRTRPHRHQLCHRTLRKIQSQLHLGGSSCKGAIPCKKMLAVLLRSAPLLMSKLDWELANQ